jgi:beta-xylosidase
MRGTARTDNAPFVFFSSAVLVLLLFGGSFRALAAAPAPSPAGHPAVREVHNPVIWEDLADLDIFRVGDIYYYSASNMHYSPGAPILRSYDLIHWQYVGHSVPVLDFGSGYNLGDGRRAYVRGTWASFLGYRKANKTFYWGGCVDFKKTYIYTAPAVQGPWHRHAVLPECYYDAGLLIDTDNTIYVAWGNTTLHVSQLSPNATHQVKTQVVFHAPPNVKVLEGSRFYKVHGDYYIFTDHPPDSEYVLKSTHGPFGPYKIRPLVVRAVPPVPGAGSPHQGGIVETQHGDWYYMAFIDAYPGGRVPVLAPMTWDSHGWPHLHLKNNQWPVTVPYPLPPHPLPPLTGTDRFRGDKLSPQWEWNHNPDDAKYSVHNGLTLQTASVTDDLFQARNTLTHRILGPKSTATIVLNDSRMKNGDRAGLSLFRNSSAWVGVERDNGKYKVVMEDNIRLGKGWKTVSTGTEVASHPISSGRIWLRVTADIHPGPGRKGRFFWSTDGHTFHPIGSAFVMDNSWPFFMGYRYAIFNYATKSLGGEVKVSSFTMTRRR